MHTYGNYKLLITQEIVHGLWDLTFKNNQTFFTIIFFLALGSLAKVYQLSSVHPNSVDEYLRMEL